MRRLIPVLLLTLIPATMALRSTRADHAELEAIRDAVNHYLNGHATGVRDTMALAFHESARLQRVSNGAYSEVSLGQYLSNFNGMPADNESERKRRIVSIDYTGTAAIAKIELDYPGVYIVDYMSLLKVDGEWGIANKIFDVERR